MKSRKSKILLFLLFLLLALIPTIICIIWPPSQVPIPADVKDAMELRDKDNYDIQPSEKTKETAKQKRKQSGAGKSLDQFYASRAYPAEEINHAAYQTAYNTFTNGNASSAKQSNLPEWEALGPKNFSGRTIGLTINPQNENTLWAGSASGGLWRTNNKGQGVNGWHYVPTGFPVLGVMSIAINPSDTNEIFIGTGEVYNYQNTGTGFADRTTRGTYGIGILKSTDNGNTWEKSLDWDFGDLKGVNEITFLPDNHDIIYAGTSEGLYRSENSGQEWVLIMDVVNVTDIIIHPNNNAQIMVAAGNLGSPDHGIYRSEDFGNNFEQLNNGLPNSYTGKVMMDIYPESPYRVVASIGDAFEQEGLYYTDDFGDDWILFNITDVCKWQGWYSHDIAFVKDDITRLAWAGIDAWYSEDQGLYFEQVSSWQNWSFDPNPVGEPEGGPDYVHGDIHRVLNNPFATNEMWYATDGGVFFSEDYGQTFTSRNGGLQTLQFYADCSNSATDSLFFIGGMQDNSTTIYEGNDSWRRVIGGDGMSTAVDPTDDNVVYGSYQNGNILKSVDGAYSFFGIDNPASNNSNFVGPFRLCLKNTYQIITGGNQLYKSEDGGVNWDALPASNINGNLILKIDVSPVSCDIICFITNPDQSDRARVYLTNDGGMSFEDITGNLPDRWLLDIVAHPENPSVFYVTAGGFGTDHVFKTSDGGQNWEALTNGLPDVPFNSLFIDSLQNNRIYAGSDIGIFFSDDDGAEWTALQNGLPDAFIAMDISMSPSNHKIRLATHGNGVWEIDGDFTSEEPSDTAMVGINNTEIGAFKIYPNPVVDVLNFRGLNPPESYNAKIYDISGRLILLENELSSANRLQVDHLQKGNYILQLQSNLSKNSNTKSIPFSKL